MKFIAPLISFTAFVGTAAAAATQQTTVTILEFGKGGTVHAAANSVANAVTTPAAMTSFWKAMHPSKNGKYSSHAYAGMSVVPDLFSKADMGVIVGIGGDVAQHLESMPTAMALLSSNAAEKKDNVVGQINIAGHVANTLVRGVSASSTTKAPSAVTDKDEFGRLLSSTATNADSGLDVVSLQVKDGDDAKEADAQLRRLIQRLRDEASDDKTVVFHLVVESVVPETMVAANRRRLQEENEGQQEGENREGEEGEQNNSNDREGEQEGEEQNNENQQGNQNQQGNNQWQNNQNQNGYTNSYGYGYKSMYEIQTFNVIAWTAVGLVVIVFSVMGAFINMPLMPDTLLFGHSAKLGAD